MKIKKAWWYSLDEVAVVFTKNLSDICDLKISGVDPLPEYSVSRPPLELYAKIGGYYIEGDKAVFILSRDVFPSMCETSDYYLCASFNDWGKAIGNEKWKLKRHRGKFHSIEVPIEKLKLHKRTALFKFASSDGRWLEPRTGTPNIERDKYGIANLSLSLDRTGAHLLILKFAAQCALSDKMIISAPQFGSEMEVDLSQILLQIHSSAKLGCYLENGRTKFSIFAPRASAAYLKWHMPSETIKHLIIAESLDGSVWTATADNNLEGALYMWHIDGKNLNFTSAFDREFPASDPYATAMLSSDGPCITQYEENLPKPHRKFTPPCWHDLVIMEAHLRDIIAKAPNLSTDERMRFDGLSKWLESPDCYIKKTGVNCVELQPIQEFTARNASDYEWGYMPVNWFSPASSYASNPQDGSQNADFAKLVDAFHKAGIAVILDVVYNHVGEPNYLRLADKEYYFELSASGEYKNFSGCGNDFRAYAPMSKRMIIDSLKHLIEHYDVDGFRFDLAELLGVGVLMEIEVELKRIKPSVILIAEPWSFRGHIAQSLRDTGYASWNDGFREFMLSFIKGSGNFEGFKYFMRGSMGGISRFPAQSVNYLESHDDMCLLDRITTSHRTPSLDDIRRYKMGYALILLAHGIPMLAEGFDLLRTKYGKNNTYKDGDANALDYARGTRFPGVARWMRRFVEFRKSDAARALRPPSPVSENFFIFFSGDNSTASAVFINADNSVAAPQIFAVFNPTDEFADIAIGGNRYNNFKHIADIDNFDMLGIKEQSFFFEYGVLKIPPLSMGIWISTRPYLI